MTPKKILIVDDRPNNLFIMETIIKDEFLEAVVIVASGGKEGLEAFHQEFPDVIVTDVRMPNMNGIELTRKIKKSNPEVLVILVSSAFLENNQPEYLECGADMALQRHDIKKIPAIIREW